MSLHKAGIAQLVEHDLAKVGVEGSSPFSRSSLEQAPKPVPFFCLKFNKMLRCMQMRRVSLHRLSSAMLFGRSAHQSPDIAKNAIGGLFLFDRSAVLRQIF